MITSLIVFYSRCQGDNHISSIYRNLWRPVFMNVLDWSVDLLLASVWKEASEPLETPDWPKLLFIKCFSLHKSPCNTTDIKIFHILFLVIQPILEPNFLKIC